MNKVDRFQCKSKITEADYIDNLFAALGDERADAELNLEMFKDKYVIHRHIAAYPDFEITQELVALLYNAYQQIESVAIPQFLSKSVWSVSQWEYELLDIL